ncbi:hypothetical protein BH23THE1_BH23THE1_27760 [soil metagenome]
MASSGLDFFLLKVGKNQSNMDKVRAILLTAFFSFYIFFLPSYFNLNVFILENREVIDATIINSFFIIDKIVDQVIICTLFSIISILIIKNKLRNLLPLSVIIIITLSLSNNTYFYLDIITILSVPLTLTLILLAKITKTERISSGKTISLFTNYFLVFLIALSIYSLYLSSLKITGYLDLDQFPRDYFYDVSILFSRLVPYMVIIIAFSLFIRVIFSRIKNIYFKDKLDKIKTFVKTSSHNKNTERKLNQRFLFIFIILLSILIPTIPHLPAINPENRYVGVDTFWYVTWIRPLDDSSFYEFLNHIFAEQSHGDRPFSLILIHLFSQLNPQSPGDTIDYLPIISTPVSTVAIYFLSKEITQRKSISYLASFFTIFSFQTIIGIYAGFYANWFGLIIGFLTIIFLLRFLKFPSNSNLILYSLTFILMIFFHVYTWTIFTAVIALFLISMLFIGKYERKTIAIALIILSCTVVIDISKDFIVGSSGGITEDIQLTRENISLSNLSIVSENLYLTALISHGGIFGNGLIFSLVLVWTLFIAKLKKPEDLFLMIFFSITSFLFLFGLYFVQVRVLYDIPFQIPFAISAIYIFSRTQNYFLLILIIVALSALGIRELINFYFIPQ